MDHFVLLVCPRVEAAFVGLELANHDFGRDLAILMAVDLLSLLGVAGSKFIYLV